MAEGIEDVDVEGLEVTVTPDFEGEDPVMVLTDENGAYSADDLLPGAYTVSVAFEQEGLTVYPPEAAVEVGRAQDVTDVDFLIIPIGSVAGTVSLGSDVEGVPVEGLVVTANADGQEPATATTDANGAYLFTELAAGTYTLTVTVPEGYVTDPEDITVVLDGSNGFAGQDFVIEAED